MLYRDFVNTLMRNRYEDFDGVFCKFYLKVPINIFEAEQINDFKSGRKTLYISKYLDVDTETLPVDALEGYQLCRIDGNMIFVKVVMIPLKRNMRRLWKSLKGCSEIMEVLSNETVFRET